MATHTDESSEWHNAPRAPFSLSLRAAATKAGRLLCICQNNMQ